MTVQPYGNSGTRRPEAPEPVRQVRYRYGIRVDSDVRGPQRIPHPAMDGLADDEAIAKITAGREADKYRGALRELGVDDPVIPWVQRVVTETITTYSEHQDLEARE